ncbi:MAG: 16S rRNA (cytidine(1402)-2'-O)-methyltransferase [Gammaproteobacteria bacterium]|nr:16S rRNA (cytidine(1402)-2'-O)-methyltransferase [Gammaproteobacteria bacterium]
MAQTSMTDHSPATDSGCLFVVATPIGNIEDISVRAIETLKAVSLIAAEDTRHSLRLCQHYGISTPMISLHEHNEVARVEQIAQKLAQGDSIALISDAGTPLISDPGFKLVRELRAQGYKISPIPGPSALITALSVAGIATDSFSFFGFLPAKSSSRVQKHQELVNRVETLVFYESSHRILASLEDAAKVYGERHAVVARELTKTYETILDGSLSELIQCVKQDDNQTKGEFVLIISGQEKSKQEQSFDSKQLLSELLQELPPNKAAKIAAKLTGEKKKDLYQMALELK